MITSLTPVVPVERIEPSAAFFAKVGFEIQVSVPEDDHMGFAILSNGTAQVMYQTQKSISDDTDSEIFRTAAQTTPVMLFLVVDSIEAAEAALTGETIVMPRRETFYGALETGYQEPGGHLVTFAEFKAGA